jgi:hypothetical protein
MFSNSYSTQQKLGLGKQGFNYDPRIGNAPLPPGFQGTAQRAYTRTPQQNELASHQLNGLLSSNNPYVTNARQRGVEQAGARGMLNSSLAAGAAERSAIEAAAPIAQADASAFGTAASENLGYLNQMAQQEAQLSAQERIANQNRNAARASSLGAANAALQRQREQLAFQGEQNALDRNQQLGMAQFGLGANLTQMGYGAQWDNWLQDQGMGRQMQRDLYNTQLGVVGNFGNAYTNTLMGAISYGMMNPDFAANPQLMTNLVGGINGMMMPSFTNFFSQLFGGGQ